MFELTESTEKFQAESSENEEEEKEEQTEISYLRKCVSDRLQQRPDTRQRFQQFERWRTMVEK